MADGSDVEKFSHFHPFPMFVENSFCWKSDGEKKRRQTTECKNVPKKVDKIL